MYGKNISCLEVYKLLLTLLIRFVQELVGGVEKKWKMTNMWFLRQRDIDCYVTET